MYMHAMKQVETMSMSMNVCMYTLLMCVCVCVQISVCMCAQSVITTQSKSHMQSVQVNVCMPKYVCVCMHRA